MFDLEENVKKQSLHDRIVEKILPCFGERLRKEGIISKHNRKRISIHFSEDWPSIRIYPDRLLYCSDGRKILVEVANPKDPKRFMGEIVYPYVLGGYQEIDAAFIFVLGKRHRAKHTRSMIEKTILTQVIGESIGTFAISWSDDEDVNYRNLKSFLTRRR